VHQDIYGPSIQAIGERIIQEIGRDLRHMGFAGMFIAQALESPEVIGVVALFLSLFKDLPIPFILRGV